MKLFERLFRGTRSRWSLQFIEEGNRVTYTLNGNSVFRLVGYVMLRFAGGKNPVAPWSLRLVFNKTGQKVDLTAECFTADGENITERLFQSVVEIDPGYQVRSGEPIFIETASNKRLQLTHPHLPIPTMDLEAMLRDVNKKREISFYDVLDDVFQSQP